MTFKPTSFVKGGDGSQIELSRFAVDPNFRVPGIASRLLQLYRRANPTAEIISYSDNRWSDGNVYRQLGFDQAAISKPGYFYVAIKHNSITRHHRSNFMRHRFQHIFSGNKLVTEMLAAGSTEWEIMQALGYDRVWDCGTTKWLLRASAK
jgi:hypothetical protein